MPDNNTRLTFRLSRPQGGGEGVDTLRLTVKDTASLLTVLEVDLPPDAFVDMMSNRLAGSVDGLDAYLTPMPMRAYLGQRRVHVTRMVDSYPPSGHDHDQWGRAINRWANQMVGHLGGDTVTVQRDNGNRTVVSVRAFFDTEVHAADWKLAAQRELDAHAGPQ